MVASMVWYVASILSDPLYVNWHFYTVTKGLILYLLLYNEEFYTLFVEIKAVVNSSPITPNDP